MTVVTVIFFIIVGIPMILLLIGCIYGAVANAKQVVDNSTPMDYIIRQD